MQEARGTNVFGTDISWPRQQSTQFLVEQVHPLRFLLLFIKIDMYTTLKMKVVKSWTHKTHAVVS
jgi:hypothetical protein